jgi:hypothetical protein
MLVRIRWFLLGALTTVGGGAWMLNKFARFREHLTPGGFARLSGRAAADALDRLAVSVGEGGRRR